MRGQGDLNDRLNPQPGEREIEFKIAPPLDLLYMSLRAMGVGVILPGSLVCSRPRDTSSPPMLLS